MYCECLPDCDVLTASAGGLMRGAFLSLEKARLEARDLRLCPTHLALPCTSTSIQRHQLEPDDLGTRFCPLGHQSWRWEGMTV